MRNLVITPPFALPLYILPISLWLLNWFYLIDPYFEAVSQLDSHTDGQSMVIGLGQVTALPALPFIVFILFLILRQYPGSAPLLSWNSQKQGLSIFWTVLFLSLSFILITEAQQMMSLGLWLNALACLTWVYLFLAFRSIVIEKTKDVEVVLPSTDPEYLICPRCKLEQWRGYDECQKCGKHIAHFQ
ncbi:hypothetical protein [Leptolyngbya sp. FACHB-711]|uniref:hypothetical protein n=1 Tax=unclassified Leptolyngbya TaxID=2650499 RepID=UPI0016838DA7|nr:hypothetical protein [Leptolyngbya sp. FACHB-711]MBD1852892.1 hypothetical protein [Cyanobacteria bacterium FACHB-502]MBD2027408.1 hypothetical protein [Leptolyngbya sp. FACHB-711]